MSATDLRRLEDGPGVSVIIPHYGDPEPTTGLVAALQAAPEPRVREIIVVDDASPIAFPDLSGVNVVRRDRNGGFGAAVNAGAAVAVGEVIVVLNSDLGIDASFVHDLVEAAVPWQPAVVSPQILRPSGEAEWVGRHFPRTRHYAVEWLTPLARFRHRRSLHEAVGHDTRCITGAIVPVDWVIGAAILLPLAEFRAVGGFDEGFHMNCEEVDLQRRLQMRGVPSIFAGTVTAVHEGGGSTDPARRRRWLVESRLRYARKWGEHPRRQILMLAGASLVNFVVNGIRQLARRPIDARQILHDELGLLRSAE